MPLQVEDIQGILLYGYGQLRHACFLLLGIIDGDAAKAWLGTLDIRNASFKPEEIHRCVNIAFTSAGLRRLGPPTSWSASSRPSFVRAWPVPNTGNASSETPARAVRTNGAGAGLAIREPHVLLMLYGRDEAALSALLSEQRLRLASFGLQLIEQLDTNWLPHDKEHFGFRDGVSQTGIEGVHTRTSPGNTIAAGEFVLGYPNAYGQYTHRPLVSQDQDPGATAASGARRSASA